MSTNDDKDKSTIGLSLNYPHESGCNQIIGDFSDKEEDLVMDVLVKVEFQQKRINDLEKQVELLANINEHNDLISQTYETRFDSLCKRIDFIEEEVSQILEILPE